MPESRVGKAKPATAIEAARKEIAADDIKVVEPCVDGAEGDGGGGGDIHRRGNCFRNSSGVGEALMARLT